MLYMRSSREPGSRSSLFMKRHVSESSREDKWRCMCCRDFPRFSRGRKQPNEDSLMTDDGERLKISVDFGSGPHRINHWANTALWKTSGQSDPEVLMGHLHLSQWYSQDGSLCAVTTSQNSNRTVKHVLTSLGLLIHLKLRTYLSASLDWSLIALLQLLFKLEAS